MAECSICYVCLDDKARQVQATVDLLAAQAKGLAITPVEPIAFERQIEALEKSSVNKQLDGLIIDLRLDESPNKTGERIQYSAQSLAQQLRTSMAQGRLQPFPIILWTVNESNLLRLYKPDRTSYDLFDAVYWKAKVDKNTTDVANKLVSLARGYQAIAAAIKKGNASIIGILDAPIEDIFDSRILVEFKETQPVHVYARFILHELVHHPGPLIDKETLLARLGISEKSKDLDKLLKMLTKKAIYKGPFSEAWPRWWWPAVEAWWKEVSDTEKPVTSLQAEERVAILSKSLKLRQLEVAKRIATGYRTFFSTICQALRQPLDPIDGFVVASGPLRSWQDRLYVSIKAALAPGESNFTGELDPAEKERLKIMRLQLRHRREEG
jgi:hypothetical protein